MRADVEIWAPDFDDIKVGTMSFEKVAPTSLWTFSFGVDDVLGELKEGDLLRVVEMHKTRPREVTVEALRTAREMRVRVDKLLDWHDSEILTILPS